MNDAYLIVNDAPKATERNEMKTPLPEPDVSLHGKHKNGKLSAESMELFTKAKLEAYGAAEYQRGIEDASALCGRLGQHAMAEAMLKLSCQPPIPRYKMADTMFSGAAS